MLAEQITDIWKTTPYGYATEIKELFDEGYPAWAIKKRDVFGVAIPISSEIEINEYFSNAKLYNDEIKFENGQIQNVLLLLTNNEDILYPFSSLCAELIWPGENGEYRNQITKNPLQWWMQWKELLGNRNVDATVYDVLGELYVLNYLVSQGKHPIWNGPDHSTYDIDCDTDYYEVKSSILRKQKQITLNNKFQLDPPDGKKLFIMYCQFEQAQTG